MDLTLGFWIGLAIGIITGWILTGTLIGIIAIYLRDPIQPRTPRPHRPRDWDKALRHLTTKDHQ